eukprot:snap_masked-scaffold_4-processed-gene-6.5-mRNA-1 protein AED:1.00 eAED:1.00 QI:0/0/0/0/1/1/2/0/62
MTNWFDHAEKLTVRCENKEIVVTFYILSWVYFSALLTETFSFKGKIQIMLKTSFYALILIMG